MLNPLTKIVYIVVNGIKCMSQMKKKKESHLLCASEIQYFVCLFVSTLSFLFSICDSMIGHKICFEIIFRAKVKINSWVWVNPCVTLWHCVYVWKWFKSILHLCGCSSLISKKGAGYYKPILVRVGYSFQLQIIFGWFDSQSNFTDSIVRAS